MSASCIYEGTVRHRRVEPAREFRHKLALAFVDLDELPHLLGGRLCSRRAGVLRFRRRDYIGDPAIPLDQAVRTAVEEHTGNRPEGPIRVLTQLRSFGHCFNPVSFYYCLDRGGERVEAVIAEVTNTPWGERHSYVLSAGAGRILNGEFVKALHVSPFMGMDHCYRARAATPGETLSFHIESLREDKVVFDATLSLRRRSFSSRSVARMTARYPLATVRVLALIYAHAVGLKLAGARVHRHPQAAS